MLLVADVDFLWSHEICKKQANIRPLKHPEKFIPFIKFKRSNQPQTLQIYSGRPCRQSGRAKLNVNTVLPGCTFQPKVQATVKGTRQLQCSRLRHFSVYFLNVQKSRRLLKSLPCVRGLLFLFRGQETRRERVCSVPSACRKNGL